MGTNLNPDGAKIKALRIQRGWTQEQLAEIAGVSARTIQRAERANAAAFETLRAVAGAFETDFDQLLMARDVPSPEHQAIHQEPFSKRDSEIVAPLSAERPDVPFGRTWPIYVVAASALVVGLIAGVNLNSHLNKQAASQSAIASRNGAATPQDAIRNTPPAPAEHPQQVALLRNTASEPVLQTAKSSRKYGTRREKTEQQSTVESAAVTSASANPASQVSLNWTPQPINFEPHPQSRDVFSTLAIPEIGPASSDPPTLVENVTGDDEDAGAVRQALGQAAKKTGSFVSRFGGSFKRVF